MLHLMSHQMLKAELQATSTLVHQTTHNSMPSPCTLQNCQFLGSAAEAKVAALHVNAHELTPVRDCLNTLKHSQPPTRIKTDNITAKGFVQGTTKQKRNEGCDRKHWWLKDRVKEFNITWAPGKTNLADSHSKHHTGTCHSKVRPIYLHEGKKSSADLQGCVESLSNAHHGQAQSRQLVHQVTQELLVMLPRIPHSVMQVEGMTTD